LNFLRMANHKGAWKKKIMLTNHKGSKRATKKYQNSKVNAQQQIKEEGTHFLKESPKKRHDYFSGTCNWVEQHPFRKKSTVTAKTKKTDQKNTRGKNHRQKQTNPKGPLLTPRGGRETERNEGVQDYKGPENTKPIEHPTKHGGKGG